MVSKREGINATRPDGAFAFRSGEWLTEMVGVLYFNLVEELHNTHDRSYELYMYVAKCLCNANTIDIYIYVNIHIYTLIHYRYMYMYIPVKKTVRKKFS